MDEVEEVRGGDAAFAAFESDPLNEGGERGREAGDGGGGVETRELKPGGRGVGDGFRLRLLRFWGDDSG